jgi:hypothetical protein
MPLQIGSTDATLLVRRQSFERVGLSRASVDQKLNLTDEEFRVEGDLIAIGPLPPYGWIGEFVEELESLGLVYFDDFFELSGNWPDWLKLFVMSEK